MPDSATTAEHLNQLAARLRGTAQRLLRLRELHARVIDEYRAPDSGTSDEDIVDAWPRAIAALGAEVAGFNFKLRSYADELEGLARGEAEREATLKIGWKAN